MRLYIEPYPGGVAFESRPTDRQSLLVVLVPPGKCLNSTLKNTHLLPSTSFLIYHSLSFCNFLHDPM